LSITVRHCAENGIVVG